MGLRIWDVRYEKEGSGWFLRYFIDRPGGITIEDCANFSRAVDPLLDRADPIAGAYCLEVSSPGIERQLTRPWHFRESMGKTVSLRLIRPLNGSRQFTGKLSGYDEENITLECEGKEVVIGRDKTAFVRLCPERERLSPSHNKGEKPDEQ